MVKWLTSLFLIAVLGGGAVAGMPLHSGEQECDMPGMKDGMDCCAKARAERPTPEVTAARLCCALNCPSPGTTAPTSSQLRLAPSVVIAAHPATFQTPFVAPVSALRFDSVPSHPEHSPPFYLRHLALLI
jgi:hypothetical protein